MLKIVEKETEEKPELDVVLREGARRMLAVALEVEVAGYIEQHRDDRDEAGRALVVRNGRAKPRKVHTGVGTIEVQAPRVNDRRVDEEGERERFTSKLLPPYMRKTPKVSELLPILYLRGLSTNDFAPAFREILGDEKGAGLSPTTITRLTAEWQGEYDAFRKRDFSGKRYVYLWADGVHFNVRLEDERLCALVIVGVREDGKKELVAVEDGYRESTESWAELLRDLTRRGLQAPAVLVGDGALGLWAAARDVWPETRDQRCWVHVIANVLSKLPRRLQGKAKRALHDIMNAETRETAEELIDTFEKDWTDKYPKAVASLTRDQDRLLTFYDFPAEHWRHLRTTNPVESPFSTVKLRTRVTKGAGTRTKALSMAYKLLAMAEERWRSVNAPELVTLVAHGVKFVDGVKLEKKDSEKDAA